MKQQISTSAAPAAIGPYSQAIKAGQLVFFSGQIPLDPVTGQLVEGGIGSQAKQVMANMGAMLKAGGLDFGAAVNKVV